MAMLPVNEVAWPLRVQLQFSRGLTHLRDSRGEDRVLLFLANASESLGQLLRCNEFERIKVDLNIADHHDAHHVMDHVSMDRLGPNVADSCYWLPFVCPLTRKRWLWHTLRNVCCWGPWEEHVDSKTGRTWGRCPISGAAQWL